MATSIAWSRSSRCRPLLQILTPLQWTRLAPQATTRRISHARQGPGCRGIRPSGVCYPGAGGFLDRSSRNGQVRRSSGGGKASVGLRLHSCEAAYHRCCRQSARIYSAHTLRHVKAISVKGISGITAEGFQPLLPLEPLPLEPNSIPCCAGALHCPAPPARHLPPGRREASRHSRVVLQGRGSAGQGRPCSSEEALNSPYFQVVRRSDEVVRPASGGPWAGTTTSVIFANILEGNFWNIRESSRTSRSSGRSVPLTCGQHLGRSRSRTFGKLREHSGIHEKVFTACAAACMAVHLRGGVEKQAPCACTSMQ